MTKRFQFMMLGAVLTLVVVGSLVFAFSWTQASDADTEMRVEDGGENGRLHPLDPQQQEATKGITAEKQTLQNKWLQATAKPGWLHVQVLYERPEADYGTVNGVTIPVNYQDESWYLVDETGQVIEQVGLMRDLNGTVIQYGIFRDGKWWNSVLKEVVDGEPFALPWSVSESTQPSSASLTRSETPTGEIVFTTVERFTAVALDDLEGSLANGQRLVDVFDAATGQHLSQETFILLANGAEQSLGRYEYLLVESVEAVPENINALFPDETGEFQEEVP